MVFYCCGITDTGRVRDHNEDAFLINRLVMSSAELESNAKAPMVAAVADGGDNLLFTKEGGTYPTFTKGNTS